MTVKVAMNGFGRIGRLVERAMLERSDTGMELVAINDLADAKSNAWLFSRDSVHGKYPGKVSAEGNDLVVDGKRIRVTFKAVDALSVIKRGEFSVDGVDWQFVMPADSIADSLSEDYSFSTPEVTAAENVIAVRVFDKAENGAVEKVVVK